MQTNLSEAAKKLPRAEEAESILRSCVHCGFCNATCPTYQLLGDELDGPRGRIYLMKQMLEGGEVTESTQLHGPLPDLPQLRDHLPVRGEVPQPAGHRPRLHRAAGAAPVGRARRARRPAHGDSATGPVQGTAGCRQCAQAVDAGLAEGSPAARDSPGQTAPAGHAPASRADARRLRAAEPVAEHQRRRCTGARPHGHQRQPGA